MSKKAAFFYIEGTFYVDKRGGASDLVKPIRDFCREQDIAPPPEVPDLAEGMPVRISEDQGRFVAVVPAFCGLSSTLTSFHVLTGLHNSLP